MTFGMFDPIPFGKYRNELMGSVIEEDPAYVHWLLNETEHRLDEDALEYLVSQP